MEGIIHTFGHVKDWNFPKFFNMRKYADCIREFGMIDVADSGKNEAMNKTLKAAYKTTNMQRATFTQQVADKMHKLEGARAAKSQGTHCRQEPTVKNGAVSASACCMLVHLLL